MNGPAAGLVMIGAAFLLIEAWRRGLLTSTISSFTAAAKGAAERRPFTLPGQSFLGGGGRDVIAP